MKLFIEQLRHRNSRAKNWHFFEVGNVGSNVTHGRGGGRITTVPEGWAARAQANSRVASLVGEVSTCAPQRWVQVRYLHQTQVITRL